MSSRRSEMWSVAAHSLILAIVLLSRVAQAEPATDSKRIVVFVSIDGLAAFYLDDPRAEMPTIRALAKEGAWGRMKASAPTVTWPNHTTLVTGVTPARHGVVGNNYFDRQRGVPVALISDPDLDKDQIVKTPTIYDVAKTAGLKTAAIRWPATRGARTLDWTFPDVASDEILHRFATPSLLAECQAVGIWSDGEVVDAARREVRIVSDEMCMKVFLHVLDKHRPQLALLHVIHVDHVQHLSGPRSPEAYAAIRAADDEMREILDALKRDYADQATLVIVSDHGFSPVERMLLPNVLLRKAGLVQLDGNRVAGGAVRLVMQGGSALVYVLDSDRAGTIERVKQALASLDGVAEIVGPDHLKDHGIADPHDDPHAPDMILFAKEGCSFAEKPIGDEPYIEKPERKGNHGHDENLPSLHATFVAWGVGIKPGVRLDLISNTDVAPTIARLLGVPLSNTDGQPIAAALAD